MALISVIIPTYNREKFVSAAIDSVLNQSFKDFELIVVDDGSTDNTRQTLERYQNRIHYIYQENAGGSAAINTGIVAARGEWLAFLDSDDQWTPEYLSKQMKNVEKMPGLCMQTTNCLFIGLNGQTSSYFEMNGSLAEFNGRDYLCPREPFQFIIQHAPWQVGSTIIRREAIHKAGLFDTSLPVSYDLDLMARVALQGAFGMIREVLINIYRREEDIQCLTQQAKNNPIEHRKNDEKMYEKLNRIKALKRQDRKILNQVMSANRRAIGNLLLKDGMITEARNCYRRAFLMDYSIKSFGKYFLSLIRTVPKN